MDQPAGRDGGIADPLQHQGRQFWCLLGPSIQQRGCDKQRASTGNGGHQSGTDDCYPGPG